MRLRCFTSSSLLLCSLRPCSVEKVALSRSQFRRAVDPVIGRRPKKADADASLRSVGQWFLLGVFGETEVVPCYTTSRYGAVDRRC